MYRCHLYGVRSARTKTHTHLNRPEDAVSSNKRSAHRPSRLLLLLHSALPPHIPVLPCASFFLASFFMVSSRVRLAAALPVNMSDFGFVVLPVSSCPVLSLLIFFSLFSAVQTFNLYLPLFMSSVRLFLKHTYIRPFLAFSFFFFLLSNIILFTAHSHPRSPPGPSTSITAYLATATATSYLSAPAPAEQ